MGFYLDVSLYELSLSSFLIKNYQMLRNIIVSWSIQRFPLLETHFHVETGELQSSAGQLTGFFMMRLIVDKVFFENIIYRNQLCVKTCNDSNTLQLIHISPNIVSGIL